MRQTRINADECQLGKGAQEHERQDCKHNGKQYQHHDAPPFVILSSKINSIQGNRNPEVRETARAQARIPNKKPASRRVFRSKAGVIRVRPSMPSTTAAD
jgi:hypothetical protein